MSKLRVLLMAPVLAAAVFAITPAAGAAADDGNFYAHNDAGSTCRWVGNAPDWSTSDSGVGCLNNDTWVWNNGYVETSDQVDVFWGKNYTGAFTCIPQGTSWDTSGHTFDHGFGLSGIGSSTYNNIASSKWVVGGIC